MTKADEFRKFAEKEWIKFTKALNHYDDAMVAKLKDLNIDINSVNDIYYANYSLNRTIRQTLTDSEDPIYGMWSDIEEIIEGIKKKERE